MLFNRCCNKAKEKMMGSLFLPNPGFFIDHLDMKLSCHLVTFLVYAVNPIASTSGSVAVKVSVGGPNLIE